MERRERAWLGKVLLGVGLVLSLWAVLVNNIALASNDYRSVVIQAVICSSLAHSAWHELGARLIAGPRPCGTLRRARCADAFRRCRSSVARRPPMVVPPNSTVEQTDDSQSLAAAAPHARYAAGTGERAEMSRDNSRREVPRINSDLIRRSSDTEGSPASILAMRDWLDWRRFARSACVRLRRRRRLRRPVANRALRSIYAASSSLRRRNSWAVPIFQPFASNLRRFSSRTVVLPEPSSAGVSGLDWGMPTACPFCSRRSR